MPNATKTVVALAVVGGVVLGTWTLGQRLFGADEVDDAGARHAVNQVWIERIPQDQRDMINHFVLVKHDEGKIGAFGKSSQWRHFVELFQWGLEGERLSVFLPQERAKAQLRVRTWECAGEAPEPFELCLEMSNGKRSTKMYSRKDWVIEPNAVEDSIESIVAAQPELATVLGDEPSMGENAPAPVDADDVEGWREVDLLAFER